MLPDYRMMASSRRYNNEDGFQGDSNSQFPASDMPKRVSRNRERLQCFRPRVSRRSTFAGVEHVGDIALIRRLFNGHFHQLRGDTKVISVEANAIVCSVGNVDLTAHSCKLTFGGKTINLTGDKAYELYATMSQAGVPPEGSAGAVHESLSHLVCTINPLEIAKRDGGGAGKLYVRCCRVATCREIKPIALISCRRVATTHFECLLVGL